MNSKLNAYIESLFANAPQTDATRELKEEMLQNLTDKYHDLIAEGKSEEEAYRIAIASIGDVSDLIGANAHAQTPPVQRPTRPRNGLITALAVVLYVLCLVPLFFFDGVVGVLLMFDMIAIATGLLIWDSPRYERPYALLVAAAVMLYILCPTPCMAIGGVTGVVLLFVLIAIATGLLVYGASRRNEWVTAGASAEPSETSKQAGKTLGWLSIAGIALTVALMIALLAVGSMHQNRRVEFLVTDEIALDDLDDIFDKRDDDDDDDDDDRPGAARKDDQTKPAQKGDQEKSAKKGGKSQQGGAAAIATGLMSVPVADVSKIEIDWVSGNVYIETGEGGEITFSESSEKTLTDRQRMHYRVHAGKLFVSYCAETWTLWDWLDIDRLNMPRKDLTVTIPQSYVGQFAELEINGVSAEIECTGAYARETSFETVSGAIRVQGIAGKELSVQSVSGPIELVDCTVQELDVESTSGDAEVDAAAEKADFKTVSGSVKANFENAPLEIETEAVSGNMTIALPQSAGNFSAKLETVSGDFSCEFPTVLQGGKYVAGTGAAEYQFESVSGDVQIQMK